MNGEVPSQPELSSNSESSNQTSVSYPYTRYNTFSASKLSGLGSRLIRFQPMRTDEFLKEFFDTDEYSPLANVSEPKSKVDEKYQARKIINDDTLNSSDEEVHKNILDTAIVEDEDEKKWEELMPGVARLAETPDKKCSSDVRDIGMTPMSSIFNRMTLSNDRVVDRTPSSHGTRQESEHKHNVRVVNNNIFKTPIVKNSRMLPPSYCNNAVSSVPSKRLGVTNQSDANVKIPAGQRIQYSDRSGSSAIKDNIKSLGLMYNQFSKKKLPDYITPRKDQNAVQPAKNVETPRLNIQASINRNHYSIPRQTLPTIRTKQDKMIQQPKNTDVVLREKDLNIELENQRIKESSYGKDKDKNTQQKQQQQQENVNVIAEYPRIKEVHANHHEKQYQQQQQRKDTNVESIRIQESLAKNVHVVSENQRNKMTSSAGDIERQTNVQQVQNVQISIPSPAAQPDHTFKSLSVRGRAYIVISKIGEGGSCQVYHCLEQDTFQARAIKVVNLAVDPTTASGYINEVKMLRDLQGNDRVIKMFEYEQIKQTLFVVMEKGDVDFSAFLRNITTESQVPTHIIICYWIEMLKCVKEIHNNGIIHSDLKPSNFLIVCGRLKLIDFGIASRLSSDMTSVIKNVQVGTFNYISPEAVLDSRDSGSPGDGKPRIRISYKSDVWSLGCILYQMVYKRTPFHNYGNPWAKISVIVDRNHCIEYPKIDSVPPHLIDIIKSCLVYEMKNRPTVEELLTTYSTNLYGK